MRQRGFTLVELVVAMAVFSMMLLIIVTGFTNIIRMHDEAVASNSAQDSARGAMDTLVSAIRDSDNVTAICDDTNTNCTTPATPTETLCLTDAAGAQEDFFYVGNGSDGTSGVMYQADTCSLGAGNGAQGITDPDVDVTNFSAAVQSVGPAIVKPEVQVSLSVGSNNGTTVTNTGPSGSVTTCANNNSDREFCSVVTLTSGAVPR